MDKLKSVLPYLLLAIAVALAYANSLGADFIYDDNAFVVDNEAIRTFAPLSKFLLSPEAFSQPANDHVYRPLASFSFAINYALGGLDVRGYHIVNLLFHLLNAFLVFVLLGRIGFEKEASLVGALIFAIHPAHVEAVTWISGRGNVLFLAFFLLSLLLYMRTDEAPGARKTALYCASVAAYALSLLAKEMALPLPALLFGYDLFLGRARDRREWMQKMWSYLPFVLTAIGYIALRTHVLGKIGQVEYHGGSAYVTLLVMLKALVIYAKLLLVPVGLSISRHFQPSHSIFEPSVFLGLCFLVVAIIVGIISFRRKPVLSFGLFWFAVAILPVSNIIPVNAIVADRFLYGPSIGFCLLAAVWFTSACGEDHRRKALSVAAMLPLVFCFMLLSVIRNNDFSNPILLWQKAAKTSPTSFVAYNNLGLQYMKKGMLPEAIDALKRAVEIKDDLPQAHVNLATCYKAKGDAESAIKHYELALPHINDPEVKIKAHLDLAVLLEKSRGISRAIEHYLEVTKLAPDDADAMYQLGRLYYGQEDNTSAMKFLRRARVIDPNHFAARQLLKKIEKKQLFRQISD